MEIRDVLFFDTETTGIPDRAAKWDVDFMEYPHVVQIAWMIGDHAETHIIRPDGWEIPDEAVAVHGITNEQARTQGEPFVFVIDRFLVFAQKAGLICGHNIHFDTGIVKANILRDLGREYYDANDVEQALFKGKRIDTMRSTMKWVDARNSWGKLKFPNLGELYARCFPGETFNAHDALDDTKAVARCLPVLIENGLVELKVKEYTENSEELFGALKKLTDATKKLNAASKIAKVASQKFGVTAGKIQAEKEQLTKALKVSLTTAKNFAEIAQKGPNFAQNEKDDKLPVQAAKAPQIENLKKITDVAAELLDQNEF